MRTRVFAGGLLLLSACGGGSTGPTTVASQAPSIATLAPAPTSTPTPTPDPPAAPTPKPPKASPTPDSGGGGSATCAGDAAPSSCQVGTGPPPATARCKDGLWSCSQHRAGTCSSHGGVACWVCPGPLC